MKTSIRAGALRRDLPLALAFAIGALSVASVSVHAANLDLPAAVRDRRRQLFWSHGPSAPHR